MIYYIIHHIATGEIMPELERGRGYTHWNPGKIPTTEVFRPRKLKGVPRLFPSRRTAARAIAAWNAYPNSYNGYTRSPVDDDYELQIGKDDGRKKEDLEVIEVDIVLK